MRLRFGLGALSNRHFEHSLFPLRTRHAQYLPSYAERFDTLELAELYHKAELEERVAHWIDQAPEGFRFPVKMHKSVVAGDRDAAALAAAGGFLDQYRALGDHLGPVVLQFPSSFRPDEIEFLDDLVANVPGAVVELRHESWWTDETRALLERHGAGLVWGTMPRAYAPPWVTGTGYVRFVGKHHNTRGRHITVEDRLDAILQMRRQLQAEAWKECYVIVTNTFEGNAVDSLPRICAALGATDLAEACTRRPGGTLFE